MHRLTQLLAGAALCLSSAIAPAVAQGIGEGLAETHGGEIRAGMWFNSDVGPEGSFTLYRPDVLDSTATLRLGIEANRYETGVLAGLGIADAFGTGLSQDIVLNTYFAQARPELSRNLDYWGGDLSSLFGKDLGNGLTLRAGPGYQIIHVDPAGEIPLALDAELAANGNTARGPYVIVQTALDRSEQAPQPASGYRLHGTAEVGRLGATTYAKLTISGDLYGRLGADTVLHARARLGRGFAADGAALPLFKNFTSAGMSDLRGFAAGGIGPVSGIKGSTGTSHVGGETAFFGGLEVAHAIGTEGSLWLLGFADLGAINGSGNPFANLGHSIGLGLRWQSPVGPLEIAVSQPVRGRATDVTETLQVSFGMTF